MGYQFEAAEVMKCLDERKLQSDIVPHSFSPAYKYIRQDQKGSGDCVSGQQVTRNQQPVINDKTCLRIKERRRLLQEETSSEHDNPGDFCFYHVAC